MTATGYARSDGNGGGSAGQLQGYLKALRTSGQNAAINARNAIEQLETLIKLQTPAAAMVIYARETTEAILTAKRKTTDQLGDWQKKAMEICAENWKKDHPFTATSYQQTAAQYANDLPLCSTQQERDKLQEKAGTLAAFYEIGALMGQDLSATIWKQAQPLGPSGFREYRDPNHRLCMLECAGAYNVNIVVMWHIPGLKDPLVIVAEAKGGDSGFGSAWLSPQPVTPGGSILAAMTQQQRIRVSQRDLLYAVSRSSFMAKGGKKGTPFRAARMEAGKAIAQAYAEERLAYITARGRIVANGITIKGKHFQCK
jgi:hypothetical protein